MDRPTSGWVNGLIGVLIFSGSLPATRVAAQGFDLVFLTAARCSRCGSGGRRGSTCRHWPSSPRASSSASRSSPRSRSGT